MNSSNIGQIGPNSDSISNSILFSDIGWILHELANTSGLSSSTTPPQCLEVQVPISKALTYIGRDGIHFRQFIWAGESFKYSLSLDLPFTS